MRNNQENEKSRQEFLKCRLTIYALTKRENRKLLKKIKSGVPVFHSVRYYNDRTKIMNLEGGRYMETK